MEIILPILVLAVLYVLEEERLKQFASGLQDFLAYLERQQGS